MMNMDTHPNWKVGVLLWMGALLLAPTVKAADSTAPATGQAEADIARAIREVTGRDARPDETNPSRFGLGYDDIKARVQATYYVCSDPAISQAIVEVTGRAPRGAAGQGECNPLLYGEVKSYEELKKEVQTILVDSPYEAGTCRNAELGRAITEVKTEMKLVNVVPMGSGELGECNSYFYGNYSDYATLKKNVRDVLTSFRASGVKFDLSNDGTTRTRGGGDCAWWDAGCQWSRFNYWLNQQFSQPGATFRYNNGMTAKVLGGGRVQVADRYGRVVSTGSGGLVSPGGGNVIATIDGRVIVNGPGNLVGNDGAS